MLHNYMTVIVVVVQPIIFIPSKKLLHDYVVVDVQPDGFLSHLKKLISSTFIFNF